MSTNLFPNESQIAQFLRPEANVPQAVAHWKLITSLFAENKITDQCNMGALFATVIVETARYLQPIREFGNVLYFNQHYWQNEQVRHALGNTKQTDAYDYRGGGFIQLTGRGNYARMEKYLGVPLLAHPDLIEKPDVSARVLLAFWTGKGKAGSGMTSWPEACANSAREATDPAMRDRCFKNVRITTNGGLNGLVPFMGILHQLGLTPESSAPHPAAGPGPGTTSGAPSQ